MSTSVRNQRFGLFGTLAVAGLSLLALAVPLSPAKAQCLGVDLGLVCAGLGTPSAFSNWQPYYYGDPYAAYPSYSYPYAYYPYPYYNPYYPLYP